jgi:hypothetical protein
MPMKAAALLLCVALAACGKVDGGSGAGSGTEHRSPAPAPAPAAPAAARLFDPSRFIDRCMGVAARRQTDEAVLQASRGICDCMNRTLKPADFDTLLNFMELDPERPDYTARVGELYESYGMTENQFATEINRIRRAGGDCRRQ